MMDYEDGELDGITDAERLAAAIAAFGQRVAEAIERAPRGAMTMDGATAIAEGIAERIEAYRGIAAGEWAEVVAALRIGGAVGEDEAARQAAAMARPAVEALEAVGEALARAAAANARAAEALCSLRALFTAASAPSAGGGAGPSPAGPSPTDAEPPDGGAAEAAR